MATEGGRPSVRQPPARRRSRRESSCGFALRGSTSTSVSCGGSLVLVAPVGVCASPKSISSASASGSRGSGRLSYGSGHSVGSGSLAASLRASCTSRWRGGSSWAMLAPGLVGLLSHTIRAMSSAFPGSQNIRHGKKEDEMTEHTIGTREQWQAAREELAKLEAEHAELGRKA